MTAEAHVADSGFPARTPAGIRAALTGEDRADFERGYQAALARAGSDFDLTPIHDLLGHWWQIAVLRTDRAAHQRTMDAAAALRTGRPVPSTPWTQVRAELGI